MYIEVNHTTDNKSTMAKKREMEVYRGKVITLYLKWYNIA